jgi:hypothetical protein
VGRLEHAAQLAEYISGLKITQLCADINIVVEGRKLDDGNVLLKFNNGANGILTSQIACGEENSLKLRFTEKKEVWNGIKWNPIPTG